MRKLFGTLTVIVLVSFACATEAATRIEIGLPDGGTLPAYLFTSDDADSHAKSPLPPLYQRGVRGDSLTDLNANRYDRSTPARPGVVVAAGAGGAKLVQYHRYCRKLAAGNYVVLLIDGANFPEFLTPGPDTWRRMPYHLWSWANHILVAGRLAFGHGWYVGNIDAAVEHLKSLPSVDSRRIALSGFSQSANASLCYASGKTGKLRAVIWNNGGSPWIMPYDPSRLPPVLILHGEKDGVYNVEYARKLLAELKDAGRDVECSIYPDQRHMFMVYYDLKKPSDADNQALASSFEKLCTFLGRTLGKEDPNIQ